MLQTDVNIQGNVMLNTDVLIIGAGATGASIARKLSQYELDVTLIDRNEDIGGYASKCNSATLCSGHDAEPGTLEGRLEYESSRKYEQICRDLDVEYRKTGMIYVAHDENDMAELEKIREKALINGEKDARLLSMEEVHSMEPSINPDIMGGLLIPNEAVVDVMELIFATVENAMDNGVRVMTSTKAEKININEDGSVRSVDTTAGEIRCRYVVNAAAIYADKLAKDVYECEYENYPRTGQFFVLDKDMPYRPSHIIVPIPTPLTRGRLLTPTIHGNLLVGPSAENLVDREDTRTDSATLASIAADCQKMIPAVNPMDSVTQFCGVRPAIKPKADWRIRTIEGHHGYIEAVGISQGVSAGPAVGDYVAELLRGEGLELVPKKNWHGTRKAIRRFVKMTEAERDAAIKEDPRYGNIICRCETVSEAEIVQAIHKGPGARSVDAVKRRLRAGMGRCQGGFCGPRVVEILARELGVTEEDICKNEPGSEMLVRVNRK